MSLNLLPQLLHPECQAKQWLQQMRLLNNKMLLHLFSSQVNHLHQHL
jgi:hypothetical protein